MGPADGVLERICRQLGCVQADVLTLPPRKRGGQLKTAREELARLVKPPGHIETPQWTSACRLATLRRDYPSFMRRMEEHVARWSWFLEQVPSESASETILQLLELERGALATHLSTAGLGFDLWPVCDTNGRGAATRLRPALVTRDYAMLFQVSVMAGGRRPRMDGLILVREPQTTFINLEVDGPGRNVAEDEARSRALAMVTLRIPNSDLLKGPSLTERLRAMGFCQRRR